MSPEAEQYFKNLNLSGDNTFGGSSLGINVDSNGNRVYGNSPTPQAPTVPATDGGSRGGMMGGGFAQQQGGFQASNPINYQGNPAGNFDDLAAIGGLAGLLGGVPLGQLGSAALNYEIGERGKEAANQVPNMLGQAAADIANQVGQAAEFRPYTVTSGAGRIGMTSGGLDLGTNQTQRNLQNQANLMSQQIGMGIPNTTGIANQAFGGVGGALGANSGQFASNLGGVYAGMGEQQIQNAQQANTLAGLQDTFTQQAMAGGPTATAESLYEQIRAMQSPEEARQASALDEKLAAQGRLGVQTNQYGGTPEQLAQQKAIAEAKNAASLSAIQQADALNTSAASRQAQFGQLAGTLGQQGANMTAQQQELGQGLLGLGLKSQELGSNLGAQDITNASNMFGLGQQASSLPLSMQAAQLGNLGSMLNTSGIPLEQQLAVLQQTSPYMNAAQQGGQMQAQALANLGKQSMAGISDAANLQAMLTQAQMGNITNALTPMMSGGGGIGGMSAGDLLTSGAGMIGGLLGSGLDWLFGDEGQVYDADVNNTGDYSGDKQYYDDNGVYDDFGSYGGPMNA